MQIVRETHNEIVLSKPPNQQPEKDETDMSSKQLMQEARRLKEQAKSKRAAEAATAPVQLSALEPRPREGMVGALAVVAT